MRSSEPKCAKRFCGFWLEIYEDEDEDELWGSVCFYDRGEFGPIPVQSHRFQPLADGAEIPAMNRPCVSGCTDQLGAVRRKGRPGGYIATWIFKPGHGASGSKLFQIDNPGFKFDSHQP